MPAPVFAEGTKVIYPARDIFTIGASETQSYGGVDIATVALHAYSGTGVIHVPAAKLAKTVVNLPDAAALKVAEKNLAAKSNLRLGAQATARKFYTMAISWDLDQMVTSVHAMRPSIEVFPHSSLEAARAISETMGRIALLTHLVTGEDIAAAKLRLTDIARAHPALPIGQPKKAVPAVGVAAPAAAESPPVVA